MASWWSRYGAQTFYRILMFLILSAVVYSGFNFVMYMVRVDGGYTSWSVYTPCSASCGGGKQSRTRSCTNPAPEYGGENCSWIGPEEEIIDCNTQPCPVNGGYSEWTEFGPCSKECGGGEQTKTRECNNPSPEHGGKSCEDLELGPSEEKRPCNEQPCPVNGGYADWGEWTECSVSCGKGSRTRARECNNPAPANGGTSCEDAGLGPPSEEEECNVAECPTLKTPTEGDNKESNEVKPGGEKAEEKTKGAEEKKEETEVKTEGENGKTEETAGDDEKAERGKRATDDVEEEKQDENPEKTETENEVKDEKKKQ